MPPLHDFVTFTFAVIYLFVVFLFISLLIEKKFLSSMYMMCSFIRMELSVHVILNFSANA